MSSGHLARNRTMSNESDRMRGIQSTMADFNMAQANVTRDFEPCDATASMFVYAQGNSVVCAHHDTLTVERRFSRHTEEIQLLAVDNVSESGTGRLVISYDAGQTAIVWDLLTGDEITRFASYDNLTVAAWMRNGNVAFGTSQGGVILFEPSTSEHIPARTIDQIPITALAPAADCRTHAIGYKNGSLLICTLQPRFTILHNLTTSRGPSPIASLAWHASSSKQKSDMLATQTKDGDLRVWSVSKNQASTEPAKVVRNLGRTEIRPGRNWLGWSKSGRIIQYSDGETTSWDVRTKLVTSEPVPTLEHVRGIALYGPGATLFTLGPNNTAQQIDLNTPPVLVANVQHPANLLPPSPPVSIEEQKSGTPAPQTDILSSIPINIDMSEAHQDHMSPLARIAKEMDRLDERRQEELDEPDRTGALSPVSSQDSFTSRSSAASRPYTKQRSVRSAAPSEHTIMSLGSSIRSKEQSVISSRDSISRSSVSTSNSSYKHRGRSSRLRQEILRSPEERIITELFSFTKSRLSDIPYAHPKILDSKNLTNDDLRHQMLSTIFGWDGEAEDLIRDELSRYPIGTPNRLLLAKWLGDLESDIMATNSESMTASDWMLLALSGIGGQSSQQKVARAYIQRLLEKSDVHTAATIMIGMGDHNDAIEIYVSHRRYMEALILTCYVYPQDWGRQTELVRKWGEWAVQHSQQQLAIRCFSCTGVESSEPWFSPSARNLNFPRGSSIPEILSPPLSPPDVVPRGPQRSMAKTAALKLVTSFGDKSSKSKFFGVDGDKTPRNAIGVTPIAESAITPGDKTAFLRPSQRTVLNTPASARTATPGGYTRQRLPSIGETPTDVTPVVRRPHGPSVSVSGESSSEFSEDHSETGRGRQRDGYTPVSPMVERSRDLKALPSPSPHNFTRVKQESRTRNGSRHRKPDGLQIQWPPMESIITGDYMTTPELSSTSSALPTGSVAGSMSSISNSGRRSPVASERSYRGNLATSPVVTGRSLEPYISSLESAQYTKPHRDRGRSSSRKPRTREPSQDRDRSGTRYIKPAKRSPTSPVPMSPEEYRSIGSTDDDQSEIASSVRRVRNTSQSTAKPGSRISSRIRRGSPEPSRVRASRPESRGSARGASRRASPDLIISSHHGRGRSKARDGSALRSPSSPLPMSPEARFYHADPDDDVEDLRAAQAARELFRSRQRSVSRVRERGTSAVRNASPERRRRDRSTSRQPHGRDRSETRSERRPTRRAASRDTRERADLRMSDPSQVKDERQRKKEAAARELEERRRSLARRPSAPPIIHPEELSPLVYKESPKNFPSPGQLPQRSQTASPLTKSQAEKPKSQPQVGLPATPRAMQHPKYDPDNMDIPEVPQIPSNYNSSQQSMGSLNEITNNAYEIPPLPKTTFTPLPKTVYQAPMRQQPPRSMSAPIPEESPISNSLRAGLPAHPAFQAALPPSNRHLDVRAPSRGANSGEAQPGMLGYEIRSNSTVYPNNPSMMGGIDETIESRATPISPVNNIKTPHPPSPPPVIKELQHLAKPPPPPPAPLYRMVGINTSGNSQPAAVEIITEGDETLEVLAAPSRNSPDKFDPPPRTGSVNHNRGRSTDNSFSSRLSRATERIRSASRGASPQLNRTKSPPICAPTAPYESVLTTKWAMEQMQVKPPNSAQNHTERYHRDAKGDMMEGGMI